MRRYLTERLHDPWGWLLLGAACRHRHPHPCQLPPPQPYLRRNQARLAPILLPPPSPSRPLHPLDCPAPSWTGMRRQRPPVQRGECCSRPHPLVETRENCASTAITAATMPRSPHRRPALDPPSLLGLLPPVGRRRRQHAEVDARPRRLLRCMRTNLHGAIMELARSLHANL